MSPRVGILTTMGSGVVVNIASIVGWRNVKAMALVALIVLRLLVLRLLNKSKCCASSKRNEYLCVLILNRMYLLIKNNVL